MAYLDKNAQTRVNPHGAGLAMILNGGIAAALIFAAPHVAADLPLILQGYQVDPPAPAPQPVEKESLRPKALKPVATVQPKALVTPPDDAIIFEPVDLKPGTGTDHEGLLKPQPDPDPPASRAEPVMVRAQPDPRFAAMLQPPYPTTMIRAGLGGVVVVRVQIGPDGRVMALEAVSASDDAFLRATREHALRKWRFVPATRDGVPIASWRDMTVRFVLPD